MKRIVILAGIVIILAVVITGWIFLGPATGFKSSHEYLYIRTSAATPEAVKDSLVKNRIVKHEGAFLWLANRMGYFNNIKPGRYEIRRGMSLFSMLRRLKNGRQTPVNMVITKLRTKEDFAKFVGRRFEADSQTMIHFLNNRDSLSRFGVDTTVAMWLVLPDTYSLLWTSSPSAIYKKLADHSTEFWNEERKQKAQAHGITPEQAYILSSIIEEETNNTGEKGNIASVYLNRMKKGMPLQADPTIKFAMHDFTLKRIYEKYLFIESPYNTYKNKGLPPGPICTPSEKTIDAVLNSPQTDYLYFVANSNFNGTHKFTSSYEEHMQNARAYQAALNHIDSVRRGLEH